MRVGCGALASGSEYRVPDCGRSSALNTETPQAELSLPDAVHQLNAGDRDRCVAKLLEPQHRSNALLDVTAVSTTVIDSGGDRRRCHPLIIARDAGDLL